MRYQLWKREATYFETLVNYSSNLQTRKQRPCRQQSRGNFNNFRYQAENDKRPREGGLPGTFLMTVLVGR